MNSIHSLHGNIVRFQEEPDNNNDDNSDQLYASKTPTSFIVFVSVFVVFCVGLAGPGVHCWFRRRKIVRQCCSSRKNNRSNCQQRQPHQSRTDERTSQETEDRTPMSRHPIAEGVTTSNPPSQELIELRHLDEPNQLADFDQQARVPTETQVSQEFLTESLSDSLQEEQQLQQAGCNIQQQPHHHHQPGPCQQHQHERRLSSSSPERRNFDLAREVLTTLEPDEGVGLSVIFSSPTGDAIYRDEHITVYDSAYPLNQKTHQRHSYPQEQCHRQQQQMQQYIQSLVSFNILPKLPTNDLTLSQNMVEHTPAQGHEHQPIEVDTHTNIAVSSVPSAATTSRLYDGINGRSIVTRRSSRSFLLWSRAKSPIPRKELLQRSVEQERNYVQRLMAPPEGTINATETIFGDIGMIDYNFHQHRANFSDAAGSALQGRDFTFEGEAEYYRRKFFRKRREVNSKDHNNSNDNGRKHSQFQQQQQQKHQPSSVINGSDCEISDHDDRSDYGSVMPPLLPDVLSPSDAPSHDPGRSGVPVAYEEYLARLERDRQERVFFDELGTNVLSAWLANLLDLAEADHETKRIITLAIPSTLGTVSDPLLRLILIALIANFVNNESMVAYVLVILFIRLTTEEISGALTDAESNMVQDALVLGNEFGYYQAGQFIQLAILMQLLIGVTVLMMWALLMDDLVYWLVADTTIASIASQYTRVIIIDYIFRGAMKAFMLPFYVTGQAQFEATVDLCATIVTIITIAAVLGCNGTSSLPAIGWIQVIIGIAKTITKVAVVFLKGWVDPYKKGLFRGFTLKDKVAVKIFLLQALPQFLGSLIELGEWETLIFFIRHLGGSEVATWAIMGVIWEVFVALTEGLGEAASVRISFYLNEGMSSDARRLAHKVSFFTYVHVLLVTSLFLMLGPRIAVLLTTSATLQHMLNDLFGMTLLANVAMTVAQISWSIAGAQGRFELASATILICRWLIILPCAALLVFHYEYDAVGVAGIIATGYSSAALYLSFKVFGGNWAELSRAMQLQVVPADGLHCGDGVVHHIQHAGVERVQGHGGDESGDASSYHESSASSHEVV